MSGRERKEREQGLQEDTSKGGKGTEQVGLESDRCLDVGDVCRNGKRDGSTRHG